MTSSAGSLSPLALDVPNLVIGQTGVEPFFYPVSARQTTLMLMSFIDDFHAYLLEQPPKLGSISEALWIMFPVLCLDVVQAYHGGAMLHRCEAAGYRPRSTFIDALVAGRIPELSRRLAIGMNRPLRVSFLRRLVRHSRQISVYKKKADFEYFSPFKHSDAERPLLFHVSGLVTKYVHESEIQPLLSYPEDWLLPGAQVYNAAPDLSTIIEPMVRRAFAAVGEVSSAALSGWVLRSAQLCCAWGSVQLAHLRKRQKVPAHFWAGTLGNPVYRAMATVVRERGGEVTGFDHGMSTGLWDTPIQTLLEFDFADRFVTYSAAMANGLRNNWQQSRSIHGKLPELLFLKAAKLKRNNQSAPCWVNDGRKIIYVPTVYSGDSVHLIPFYSDIQMVDWQVRLLSYLRNQGLEVSIKPHPESLYSIPSELAELVDGRILSGRFEDLNLDGATLIFDYPQTSAFVRAVRSDNPIIVIDFDRLGIRNEARLAIESRCALVRGTSAEDGRLQVDWPELNGAIKIAPSRIDQKQLEQFFSGL